MKQTSLLLASYDLRAVLHEYAILVKHSCSAMYKTREISLRMYSKKGFLRERERERWTEKVSFFSFYFIT
jgi:hypothetical protein